MKGAETKTLKASRGWKMERGCPLSVRQGGLGNRNELLSRDRIKPSPKTVLMHFVLKRTLSGDKKFVIF